MDSSLDLYVLPERLAICRLGPEEKLPPWAGSAVLLSVTRTQSETTVVCQEENVPAGITCNKSWRCLRIEGVLDFSQTGILSSLTAPLAEEGIPIYALSTYSTDLILIKEKDLSRAVFVLTRSGNRVFSENGQE
ncbi:MAG: ACT domain-containing protein [Deltaproteobacteria bacterium]|nr:ACT domain-containing protein [Deltaproteobacteria bacterium]NTV56701.1 ACT domain-containing protein [Deltaproteobacteria bacterium]